VFNDCVGGFLGGVIMDHKFKLYFWQHIYLVPSNSARTTGGHAALSAAAGDVHHVKPD